MSMETQEINLQDHDQLPAVEEVRTSHGPNKKKPNTWQIFGLVMLFIIPLVIGLSVGLAEGEREERVKELNSEGDGTVPVAPTSPPRSPPTPPPTLRGPAPTTPSVPDSVPTPHPTNNPDLEPPAVVEAANNMVAAVRFVETQQFLEAFADDPTAVKTDGTPQFKAALWMSNEDAKNYDIPTGPDDPLANKFLQRYILTVIYYAMNGNQWQFRAHFASNRDECNWYETFGAGVEQFTFGATCDDDGNVVKLFLRKYQHIPIFSRWKLSPLMLLFVP